MVKKPAPPAPRPPAPPPIPKAESVATGPQLDVRQAPPDAKPLEPGRPPAIVPDAPTIDQWTIDGKIRPGVPPYGQGPGPRRGGLMK